MHSFRIAFSSDGERYLSAVSLPHEHLSNEAVCAITILLLFIGKYRIVSPQKPFWWLFLFSLCRAFIKARRDEADYFSCI